MGVTQTLVREVREARFTDIPPTAVENVAKGILDDIGIAFLGYTVDSRPLVEYAKDVGGGRPESTIIGDGSKVLCSAAAAVNAQMALDTNFQETGPGHHILSVLAQTAIAVGERVGASGKDIITAVAVGYEMSGRFHFAVSAKEMGTGLARTKRHLPVTITLVAGKLLGLDSTQMNRAVGLVWYFVPLPTAGVSLHPSWMRVQQYNVGLCQVGIQAALLAQKGLEGPVDLIDRDSLYDLERLQRSPEPYYYAAHMLKLKPWQTSRPGMQAIPAALELVEEHRIRPQDIEAITFRGPSIYLNYPHNNPRPTRYWDALQSMQWALAAAVLGCEPGRWYTEERLRDPACRALAEKVVVEEDLLAEEELREAVPTTSKVVVGNIPIEVEIVANGKRFRKRKTTAETLGSPTTPMSWEQVVRKFKGNAAPVIGDSQSDALAAMLTRLGEQQDIRGVTRLFKAA